MVLLVHAVDTLLGILGVTMAPFDGNLVRARRADDTLHDRNGNVVGCWLLVVGSWYFTAGRSPLGSPFLL